MTPFTSASTTCLKYRPQDEGDRDLEHVAFERELLELSEEPLHAFHHEPPSVGEQLFAFGGNYATSGRFAPGVVGYLQGCAHRPCHRAVSAATRKCGGGPSVRHG